MSSARTPSVRPTAAVASMTPYAKQHVGHRRRGLSLSFIHSHCVFVVRQHPTSSYCTPSTTESSIDRLVVSSANINIILSYSLVLCESSAPCGPPRPPRITSPAERRSANVGSTSRRISRARSCSSRRCAPCPSKNPCLAPTAPTRRPWSTAAPILKNVGFVIDVQLVC